ncbi:unnamed protein product, partial [Ixodes persulcatus]
KTAHRLPPLLAARKSGHVIWIRLYAVSSTEPRAGAGRVHGALQVSRIVKVRLFPSSQRLGRATTRKHVEASNGTSQNLMPTQCTSPMYEPHLNIVAAGIAKPDDAPHGIALLALSSQLRHQVLRRRD